MPKIGLGLLGVALAIPVSLALSLGFGVRACLRDPSALLFVTAQSFVPFAIIRVLPALATGGFVVGSFAPISVKVMLRLALVLMIVAFAIGYAFGPPGACVILW
jgi:hypothetical protein